MYSDQNWKSWIKKERQNFVLRTDKKSGVDKRLYLKKGYLHFDPRFWLPEREDELKVLLADPIQIASRPFLPLIRVVESTPRYRYDEENSKRTMSLKDRPIAYASHLDSLIFSFYSHCLNEKYLEFIESIPIADCILAYRTDLNKCNIDFARDVFDYIRQRESCVAITLDVKSFFDNLNHDILKQMWKKVVNKDELPNDQYHIYKTITKYSYAGRSDLLDFFRIPKKELRGRRVICDPNSKTFNRLREKKLIHRNENSFGIPQGLAISSILSNIYMIDYDLNLHSKSERRGFLYRRYCDDILIICNKADASEIRKYAYQKIDDYNLQLQTEKEEQIEFKLVDGLPKSFDFANPKQTKKLQYLGFEFDGINVFIRESTLSRFYRNLKKAAKETIKRAYGKGSKGRKVYLRKIYKRYTHLGSNNFITYALRAAGDFYETKNGRRQGFNSNSIKRQISGHMRILKEELHKRNIERMEFKMDRKKLKRKMEL